MEVPLVLVQLLLAFEHTTQAVQQFVALKAHRSIADQQEVEVASRTAILVEDD